MVSPWDGGLDFMTAEKMNTENMSRFLDQVGKAHRDQFIVMVVDGASSHRSKELEIPKNMSLIRLPPYSPELNPDEYLNGNLKNKVHSGKPVRNREDLEKKTRSFMRTLLKRPAHVQSYFKHLKVAYAA